MVADSITDSEKLHGSPISRDFSKKRKANWFWKLEQWKFDGRRRQWKRANADEDESGSRLKSLRDKLTDRKTASEMFSYLEAWKVDHEEVSYKFTRFSDDDETDLDKTLSANSPTSVLKYKDSDTNKTGDDHDCFCCSKQIIEEEEEAFDDAFDNWEGFSDALNFFENETTLHDLEKEEDPNPNTSQRENSSPEKQESSPENTILVNRKKKKKSEKQQDCDEISECPICSEEMDATDLSFLPCPCGFRICLFCHKKINENDGRCPSCRKMYNQARSNSGEVSFQQRGRGTVRLSPSFRGLDRA